MQWVQWEPRQCHRCRCISLGCRAHAAGGPGTAGVPRACRACPFFSLGSQGCSEGSAGATAVQPVPRERWSCRESRGGAAGALVMPRVPRELRACYRSQCISLLSRGRAAGAAGAEDAGF